MWDTDHGPPRWAARRRLELPIEPRLRAAPLDRDAGEATHHFFRDGGRDLEQGERVAHIDPAEAVRAHHVLRSQTSVAIHFGSFELGDDGQFEPVRDLERALAANGSPRFWILDQGEGRDVPPCD